MALCMLQADNDSARLAMLGINAKIGYAARRNWNNDEEPKYERKIWAPRQ